MPSGKPNRIIEIMQSNQQRAHEIPLPGQALLGWVTPLLQLLTALPVLRSRIHGMEGKAAGKTSSCIATITSLSLFTDKRGWRMFV